MADDPLLDSGSKALDGLNRFLRYLGTLDDRAMVLALGEFANVTLEALLIQYLGDTKDARELIAGYNAPIGTFATRIRMASTLGLLHPDQSHDLRILKDIRNAFAHDFEGISFDSPDIKSQCGKLVCYTIDEREHRDITKSRGRLEVAIQDICIELRVLLGTLEGGKRQKRPDVYFRLLLGKPEKPGDIDPRLRPEAASE
jgi:hypothetical protein